MITYNAGRFEVLPDDYWSKDPTERGPLVWSETLDVFFINKPRLIGRTEFNMWAYYYNLIKDQKQHYDIAIGKYIGKAQANIDDIIEVKLF